MTGVLAGSFAASPALFAQAASWQENANYVFEYLTEKLGYTEAAACGIMANIRCESTFNPHAWNAGGGSYGLCQWTGGRYGRLRNWCGSNGYDYTTIDGQLAYLEYELENHYPRVEEHLRSVENTADGAYDAGQYYCYHFEAPASRGSVSVYRGGLASGTFWDSYRPAEWYKVDGIWHYILRDGSYHKEWLTIDDETFYLDREGRRVNGWRTIDANRYFFEDDGVMTKGWKKINGRNYYFGEDGALVTGLIHSGDDWYLLDASGNVQASADMAEFAPVWLASVQKPGQAAAALAEAGTEHLTELSLANLVEPSALKESDAEQPVASDDYVSAAESLLSAYSVLYAEEDGPAAAAPGFLLPYSLPVSLPALSLAEVPGEAYDRLDQKLKDRVSAESAGLISEETGADFEAAAAAPEAGDGAVGSAADTQPETEVQSEADLSEKTEEEKAAAGAEEEMQASAEHEKSKEFFHLKGSSEKESTQNHPGLTDMPGHAQTEDDLTNQFFSLPGMLEALKLNQELNP